MQTLTRRRFLETAAALAALAPLGGCARNSAGPGAARNEWMDAVALAEAVSAGRVTARALVDDAIRRLELVNPVLNAVALPNFERARTMAAAGASGPLGGVPTLIKDNLMQEGLPYTQGSRALADYIAVETHPYAAAIERAGLISIGRSTLPEFGLTATTEPLLTGPTRNPWDTSRSAGGSSGGSAAAVAAGVVPVAHANDGGGSIRIPASACGLVGLKPSRGRMVGSTDTDHGYELGVQGAVSRTVRDTAAWFHATQRTDANARFAPAPLVTGRTPRSLRIGGRLANANGAVPDAAVARVFDDTFALLGRLGHTVSPRLTNSIVSPATSDMFLALWSRGASNRLESAREMGGLPADAKLEEHFEPLMLGMAEAGAAFTEAEMETVTEQLDAFKTAYRAQFDDIDVYVTPTLGKPAVEIGYIAPTISFEDQRERLSNYAGYTGSENVAGVPSISLPMGYSAAGLPIGMQFAAAPGEEALLLGLAYELESELRWYENLPTVWVGGVGEAGR